MRELNLIIVGDKSCGTTRAYLQYLKKAGLQPRELWLVDFFPADERTRRLRDVPLIGPWLGNRHHGSLAPPSFQYPSLYFDLCDEFQSRVPVPVSFFGAFDYASYVGKVRHLVAEDYCDPYLQQLMKKNSSSAFLYTNGGIVPKDLLGHPEIRVFHVHPGIVPEVRGSDCFLWSIHKRGRPGASCFYMAPGIDEGDILDQSEFNLPSLSFLKPFLRAEDEDTVCRAIAKAFDPHMRAMLFARALKKFAGDDVRKMAGVPQQISENFAFLWMHPKVRLKVLTQAVEASQENENDVLGFSET